MNGCCEPLIKIEDAKRLGKEIYESRTVDDCLKLYHRLFIKKNKDEVWPPNKAQTVQRNLQICSYNNQKIAGVMNDVKETLVNGKNIYKRICIRKL